jgi:hypothetical protein
VAAIRERERVIVEVRDPAGAWRRRRASARAGGEGRSARRADARRRGGTSRQWRSERAAVRT